MKAIVFSEIGGPEVLALGDVATPAVRAGMVLLRNHAIGVSFAPAFSNTSSAVL